MARVVVLPQNYEELSPTERSAIVPICMAAFDRQGQPIPPEWFSKGVEPVREHLVNIARHILGDPEAVIHAIATFRSDKPNPQYYARLTVTKAAAGTDPQDKPKQEISPSLSLGLG